MMTVYTCFTVDLPTQFRCTIYIDWVTMYILPEKYGSGVHGDGMATELNSHDRFCLH